MVKVAKLHTKWYSSFFLFEVGREKRVKNTRTNERKSSFLLKKKKEESKFFTRTLLERVSVSLRLCVSFESESKREKERVGWSRYVEGFDQSSALFYRGFPGDSSWFRKRLKVKS